ncbi:MAG: putative baseplate assembly protein [Pyrinomonadaceae bacterium]
MRELCGCCEGVERATPAAPDNRPGLSALSVRVGTHATFLETMLARLSSHSLPTEQAAAGQAPPPVRSPLLALTTRDAQDASIAFLDAWATVADVLTFYQERIANEGYLRTATERRSVLELARLVGYQPRPGVAASVYLAYTLEDGSEVSIPTGSRAQSVPGPGELPQSFETAEELLARGVWNLLRPRLTRPQQQRRRELAAGKPLYLKGTATNLRPNDPLLIDFGETRIIDLDEPRATLFRVVKVEPDQANDRTKVELKSWVPADRPLPPPTPPLPPAVSLVGTLDDIIARHRRAEDFGVNAATQTAQRVLNHLTKLHDGLNYNITTSDLLPLLERVLPPLREEYRLAREGNFTKLAPWLESMISELEQVLQTVVEAERARRAAASGPYTSPPASPPESPPEPPPVPSPALVQLSLLLNDLEKPLRVQPRSKQDLGRSLTDTFNAGSDALPRLLTALRPGVAPGLYRAWANLPVSEPSPMRAYTLRARASVFGHNAPLKPVPNTQTGGILRYEEWTLLRDTGEPASEVFEITINRFDRSLGQFTATVNFVEAHASASTPGSLRADDNYTLNIPAVGETITLRVSQTRANADQALFLFEFQMRRFSVTVDWLLSGATVAVASLGNSLFRVAYMSEPFVTSGPAGSVSIRGSVARAASRTPTEQPYFISLDTTYKEVLPDTWAVLEGPERLDIVTFLPEPPLITKIARVRESTRADYGITAKGTQLQLRDPWITPASDRFERSIRGTTVFVQSEELELAEEPLDPVADQLCGKRIELADLVAGLEPGRWLIVSGERTDIIPQSPSAASAARVAATLGAAVSELKKQPVLGVRASELVMLAGIEQGHDARLPGDRTHTTLLLATNLAYCYKLDTVRVYGNVVRATHGETRTEVLGSGDAGKGLQSFTLNQAPLTYVSAPTPAGIESTLTVRVNDIRWQETDSLAGLGPQDRRYVTKTDDESKTTIIFGNGRAGARLPTGTENVRATYRTGIGQPGNVKAEQITLPVSQPLGVKQVINPRAAQGGAGRESRDEARRNASRAVMALDRLVSTQDYEDFARTFAGIGKASATRISDGRRQVVHLTIAGADDIPIAPDSDLYNSLRAALGKYSDPFQPVQVAMRFLKVLFISARARVHPDYLWQAVEPKMRVAMLERFSFNRRDLGQDVVLSEVIDTMQAVEGVVYVDVDVLDAVEEGISTAMLLRLAAQLRLNRRIRVNLARVDRTALDPAVRIRPAQLAVLTPLVPDTLNLTELK